MSESILVDAFRRSDEEKHLRQFDDIRKAIARFEEDESGDLTPETARALLAIHRRLQRVRGLDLKVEFSPYVQKVMESLDLQAVAV